MKAGIIGGTGKMGHLFVPVFERAGYDVLVTGRSTSLTNADCARQCELVIVSVPIRDTVRVIGEIAPLLARNQLLCDLTSLKVRPVEAMLKSKANVVGLHPMFGPSVSSLKSQTIIVCPVRAEEHLVQRLVAIFRAEGARCTQATPEEHDRMMAVVQGLTHYVTLCMAESIRRLGMDIGATREYTSPVYQIELSLVGRLLSQDPDLYADILQQNPYVPEVLEACRSSAGDLAQIVGSRDPELFRAFFMRNSRHLGPWCTEGQEMTDTLIDCMVNR
ncbi:MAG: prephenate dehydrogenase/arogenate dehydrogenase family protein [Methanoregula sp.]